jgi:hypothetical protein
MTYIKELVFPTAALLYSFGSLWNAEKTFTLEKYKHTNQRNDTYWDKRFAYYHRFKDTMSEIFSLSADDAGKPLSDPNYDFAQSKFGKLYEQFSILSDEGEILFENDIVEHVKNAHNIMEEIKMLSIKLFTMPKNDESMNFDKRKENADEMAKLVSKISDLKVVKLQNEYKECRKKIFAYLKTTEGKPVLEKY